MSLLPSLSQNAELQRLQQRDEQQTPWQLWGTFLPDRQWGTVREDYSADGDAWRSFPHDHARSRAYRWGEDGLLGWTDRQCRLCFSPVFWNGEDPILKERFFGLANHEGNHGEDLKEIYFHIRNTPTHSYAKALYLYPHQAFPYERLVVENRQRSRSEHDFNIEDTGVFDDQRFFRCFIEYAKKDWNHILIRIRIENASTQHAASLSVIPTLWLRNTWAWDDQEAVAPSIQQRDAASVVTPDLDGLGRYRLFSRQSGEWLFTDNETNSQALFGSPSRSQYTKDAFHRFLIAGETDAVRRDGCGSKAAVVCRKQLQPGESWSLEFELQALDDLAAPDDAALSDSEFASLMANRQSEAEDYFHCLAPSLKETRQQLFATVSSAMLWTNKYYRFNVMRWLQGDPTCPPPPHSRWHTEYRRWRFIDAEDIFAMPDGWEYPYFCKWDLMFHAVALADVDPAFAKYQTTLLRQDHYTAANAQAPAYEWAFSDVDPPLGAWATWRVFQREQTLSGTPDHGFLLDSFHSLMIEYGWWANRNDHDGDTLFDGGFLGLDNISPFDRRYALPDGTKVNQSDGTAWMARLSLYMASIAAELAGAGRVSPSLVRRFLGDFLELHEAINSDTTRGYTCWDEQDRFYYDLLVYPDRASEKIRVRSVSGLIPLLAIQSFDASQLEQLDCLPVQFSEQFGFEKINGRYVFSLLSRDRLRDVCRWFFDEEEFLSPHGIRSLSKVHLHQPYSRMIAGVDGYLSYCPGESPVPMFGGNSNWRGPVWMPINYMMVEALREYAGIYGPEFKLEYPTASGNYLNLSQIADDLEQRLLVMFLGADDQPGRPFERYTEIFSKDPSLSQYYLFHEYFHGDDGGGLGASHQTGWSAMIRCFLADQGRNSET